MLIRTAFSTPFICFTVMVGIGVMAIAWWFLNKDDKPDSPEKDK